MKSRTFGSSSRTIDNIMSHVLWAVMQILKPHQVEEVNCMLPTSSRPQTSWNQKVKDADSPLPHHQPIRRMSMSWPRPAPWTLLRLLTSPSRGAGRGTHGLEGISLLRPPLPGKAIKLFLSASPKMLFPRSNPAPVYRGRISATAGVDQRGEGERSKRWGLNEARVRHRGREDGVLALKQLTV